MVFEISPPECEIPLPNSANIPIGGTGSRKTFATIPEIALSSECKPLRLFPSNFILLAGPGPPIKCNVILTSSLIPWERNNAEFTALSRTSILPPIPEMSLSGNFPELMALCPMIAKSLFPIGIHPFMRQILQSHQISSFASSASTFFDFLAFPSSFSYFYSTVQLILLQIFLPLLNLLQFF